MWDPSPQASISVSDKLQLAQGSADLSHGLSMEPSGSLSWLVATSRHQGCSLWDVCLEYLVLQIYIKDSKTEKGVWD